MNASALQLAKAAQPTAGQLCACACAPCRAGKHHDCQHPEAAKAVGRGGWW